MNPWRGQDLGCASDGINDSPAVSPPSDSATTVTLLLPLHYSC